MSPSCIRSIVRPWTLAGQRTIYSSSHGARTSSFKSSRGGPFTEARWACAPAALLGLLGLLVAAPARAAETASSTALTIYSHASPGAVPPEVYLPGLGSTFTPSHYRQMIPGYAIVKQERRLDLTGARTVVRFTDVASQIDPTTVSFASLTDPQGTQVLEQNYEFDLVSAEKLLKRYVDQTITVEQVHGDTVETIRGKLLSTMGGLVLQNDDQTVRVVNGYSNIQFPQLPGGLITRPTLVWDVAARQPGPHDVRVTYETKAMTWWADYNVIFAEGADANQGKLDLGAWVTIINQSGATYGDARLKLIAGDVHRAPEAEQRFDMRKMRGVMAAEAAMAPGFEEKAFFEYHLYTLGRPTTLPDNSTKQIELFPTAREVPCEKVLVYYGQGMRFPVYGSPMTDRNFGVQSNQKVDIYLKFKNEKAIGLGMPLPSGRIRVSQLDPADQTLEFIGEDSIDHTPKDEQVLIKMGSAFDVVGERRQVDFAVDTSRKRIDETVEIKVRNHKEEPVKVIVKENLYRWTSWTITKKSHEFEKVDARTIHFPITIEKDGEVVIEYSVRYTW